MSAAASKPYRRSWKNLLIDKSYQLRFTLFMVVLSATLTSGLGYWVIQEARKATTVGMNDVKGRPCPAVPPLTTASAGMAPAAHGGVVIDDITEMQPPAAGEMQPPAAGEMQPPAAGETQPPAAGETQPPAAGAPAGSPDPAAANTQAQAGTTPGEPAAAAAGTEPAQAAAAEPDQGTAAAQAEASAAGNVEAEAAGDDAARARPRVILEESSMALEAPAAGKQVLTPGFVDSVAQHYQCRHDQVGKIAGLREGYKRITLVLVVSGVLLIIGLTLYGIKMTHKVAGPLHKVSLYFDKMRDGRLDQVYDLRKGDQLVEFYEQFKAAHEGLKMMQELDIEHLRGTIEAAEAENLAQRSPEIAALLDEMRELLARKEKSLE